MHDFSVTRRQLFAIGASACVVPGLGQRVLNASSLTTSITGDLLLPDPVERSQLQELAASAMDVARQTGASYGDIRIGNRQLLSLLPTNGYGARINVHSECVYGIRAIVNGATAFIYGRVPTKDAIAAAARDAVATARGLAPYVRTPPTFSAATPIVDHWETPVQIDPFLVPIEEQVALLMGLREAAEAVKHMLRTTWVTWTREDRVFASTDGSMLTQRFTRCQPTAVATDEQHRARLPVRGLEPQSGGYELFQSAVQQVNMREAAEEVARLAKLPTGTMDVGRYDVVLEGRVMATFMLNTLAPALELDRALGHEVGASGSSFAAPPNEVVGTEICSPLVTLRSDRESPSPVSARWDDDGVPCRPFTLVEGGRLIDFFSTRATAAVLHPWYEQQGKPLGSRGCAVSVNASDPPFARPGQLTLVPNHQSMSLDDLCRPIQKGILVRNHKRLPGTVLTDQQGASFQFGHDMYMYEIKDGRIVRKLTQNAIQGDTQQAWKKSIHVFGDRTTVGSGEEWLRKGAPVSAFLASATAPAAHMTEMDVITVGGRA